MVWGKLSLILLLSLAKPSAVLAATQETQAAQGIANKIEENKNLVTQSEVKRRHILSRLFEINQRIRKNNKEKSDLDIKKRIVEKNIQDLEPKIQKIQESIQDKGRLIVDHIKWIHQSRDFAWLNLFSGSRGPADMDLNLHIFKKFTDKEKEKIVAYLEARIQLEKSQKKLKKRHEELSEVSAKLAEAEAEFMKRQQERKKALNIIKKQKDQVIAKIQKIKNSELAKKLEDSGLLDGLLQDSFIEAKGNLKPPTQGVLLERFGIVKDPESAYYKNNKGIFIQTNSKRPVAAVFGGKVAFVGKVGGFGDTVILDHGDHYYTVYSSLRDAQVRVGQNVEQNADLGWGGNSQFFTSSGVYFEVRHFSEPQDPTEWLMKGSL